MTDEEAKAVAAFELRMVGIHPDYIKLLLEKHKAEDLIRAAPDIGRICSRERNHPWLMPYDKKTDFVFKLTD